MRQHRPEPTQHARTLVGFLEGFNRIVGWDWELEAPIFDPVTRRGFFLDLYDAKAKLAIELNGRHHYENADQMERDKRKQACANRLGIEVLWERNMWVQWSELEFAESEEAFNWDNYYGLLENYEKFTCDVIARYFEKQGFTSSESFVKMRSACKARAHDIEMEINNMFEQMSPGEFIEFSDEEIDESHLNELRKSEQIIDKNSQRLRAEQSRWNKY